MEYGIDSINEKKIPEDQKILEKMGEWRLWSMLKDETLTGKEVITILERKVKMMKEEIEKLSFYKTK